MTTASKPSGSGSPVSTTTYAAGSRKTGAVSLAPTVSAARTAMPSIAAASKDGEERVAHTGSAVTRPTASASADARGLDARRAAGCRARRAPGGERLGGRHVADERGGRHQRYSVTSTSVAGVQSRSRPRARRGSRRPRAGPTAAPRRRRAASRRRRAPRPGRRRAVRRQTAGRARGARSRPARAAAPRSRRRDARPASRSGERRRAPSAGCPAARSSGTPPQSASSVGLPGRSASPWQQISPQADDDVGGLVARPTDEPAETTTTSLVGERRRQRARPARRGRRGRCRARRARRRPRARAPRARRRWRRGPGRPRASRVAGSTTSSPVDRIATRGRAWTSIVVTPAAASSARSGARSGRPAGCERRARAPHPRRRGRARRRARRGARPRSFPPSPPACARP